MLDSAHTHHLLSWQIAGSLVAGEEQELDVLPTELAKGIEEVEEDQVMEDREEDAEKEEEKEVVVVEVIKRRNFPGKTAQGLRIREKPNFAAALLGIIKPGDIVHYTEEVR